MTEQPTVNAVPDGEYQEFKHLLLQLRNFNRADLEEWNKLQYLWDGFEARIGKLHPWFRRFSQDQFNDLSESELLTLYVQLDYRLGVTARTMVDNGVYHENNHETYADLTEAIQWVHGYVEDLEFMKPRRRR